MVKYRIKVSEKFFDSKYNSLKPLKPLQPPTIGGLPHTPLVFATELPVLALALLLTPNTGGWGKYAHLTFLQLALQDAQYAQWLLSISKYTTKTRHACFHPDNKEICKLLKKGIEQNRT